MTFGLEKANNGYVLHLNSNAGLSRVEGTQPHRDYSAGQSLVVLIITRGLLAAVTAVAVASWWPDKDDVFKNVGLHLSVQDKQGR